MLCLLNLDSRELFVTPHRRARARRPRSSERTPRGRPPCLVISRAGRGSLFFRRARVTARSKQPARKMTNQGPLAFALVVQDHQAHGRGSSMRGDKKMRKRRGLQQFLMKKTRVTTKSKLFEGRIRWIRHCATRSRGTKSESARAIASFSTARPTFEITSFL